MANIKSQKKRNLTNEKAHQRNKAAKAELKSRIKAAEAEGFDNDAQALRVAIKRLDMAASKGIIHKNTAARKKSRLLARLHAVEVG